MRSSPPSVLKAPPPAERAGMLARENVGPRAPWGRFLRMLAALLAAFVLMLVIALARLRLQKQSDALFVSDPFGYYVYLPSLVIDGDLDLANQFAGQPEQKDHDFYQVIPKTGKVGNPFQVGCAMMWSGFFLLAHGNVLLLRFFGWDIPADGFGLYYELPVYCGIFLLGLVGVFYIYRLVSDLWGQRVGTAATAAIVLASPLAAYLWFDPAISHSTSMCLISMLFYYLHLAHRGQDLRPLIWARIGALCGLIVATRATDIFVGFAVAWIGLSVAFQPTAAGLRPAARRIAGAVASLFATAFLFFLPQMLAWKVIYGHFLVVPQGTGYTEQSWWKPELIDLLFSSRRSLFAWSPLLLVACAGLVLGVVKRQARLICGLLIVLMAAYFISSAPRWWAGCDFGMRRMVDYSVIFALGLGYLFHQYPSLYTRTVFRTMLVLLVAFNWILMVRYFTHDLPEWGYVSWYNLYARTLSYPFRMVAKLMGGDYSIEGGEWHT
jgi:hypothetical protein